MFVVSTQSIPGQAIPQFHNALANDAFGNFSAIMKDVALSPAMGGYLNMLNSAAPATGQIANENFARENMQLFTIGLNQLNQDGTPQLDGSGNPIPSYSQAQVQAFCPRLHRLGRSPTQTEAPSRSSRITPETITTPWSPSPSIMTPPARRS